jgi:hypothetical protein
MHDEKRYPKPIESCAVNVLMFREAIRRHD